MRQQKRQPDMKLTDVEIEDSTGILDSANVKFISSIDRILAKFSDIKSTDRLSRIEFWSQARRVELLYQLSLTSKQYLDTKNRKILRIQFEKPEQYIEDDLITAIKAIEHLQKNYYRIRPLDENVWRGCSPEAIDPTRLREIAHLVTKCYRLIREIQFLIDKLSKLAGVNAITTLNNIPRILNAARLVITAPDIDRSIMMNPHWDEFENKEFQDLIKNVDIFQTQYNQVKSKFKRRGLQVDLKRLIEDLKKWNNNFLPFMDKNKKNIEKQLALVYREEPPRSRSRIISDLEQLLPIWTLSNEIGWAKQQGTTYFGTYWQGKFSDVKKLRSIAAWMISFRRSISERLLREDSIDIITNDPETHKIKVVLSQLNNSSKRFLSDFSKLKSLLQLDERIAFDRSVYAVPIQEIARRLQLWKENIFNLIAWTKSAFAWNKCMRTMAREVVVQCEQSSYCQMNDLLPCFIINYVNDLFKKIKSNES